MRRYVIVLRGGWALAVPPGQVLADDVAITAVTGEAPAQAMARWLNGPS